MPTTPEQIKSAIINLLEVAPQGMHSTEIVRSIESQFPDVKDRGGRVIGQIRGMRLNPASNIIRPSRGLYLHTKFQNEGNFTEQQRGETREGAIHEGDFYQPFADYLVDELEECTQAISLGGNIFGVRWGTPDVIGKNEASQLDIIKHDTEIISAEIKIDTAGLITAFGQACSYRLFSHKVYIVIPKSSREEDKSRIESLCLISGIGLIFFESNDKENPNFEIRVRPIKHEPDMFYMNEYIRLTGLFN
ncbi:MAG: hypothetical protein HY617_00095 [Candidatus Sungbacteria bacterium]|nr:hypothetical protein [Candidatus Sungbacteria bacterium]